MAALLFCTCTHSEKISTIQLTPLDKDEIITFIEVLNLPQNSSLKGPFLRKDLSYINDYDGLLLPEYEWNCEQWPCQLILHPQGHTSRSYEFILYRVEIQPNIGQFYLVTYVMKGQGYTGETEISAVYEILPSKHLIEREPELTLFTNFWTTGE